MRTVKTLVVLEIDATVLDGVSTRY